MNFDRLMNFNKVGMTRSAVIVLIYKIAERIIMLGRGVLFARVLGPAGYGVFSLALSIESLAVGFAKLWVPSSFTRYIPQYELKGALRDFLKRTYAWVAIGTLIVSLGCSLFASRISQWVFASPDYTGIIRLIALLVIPGALFQTLDATFTGLRNFKLQSLLKLGQFTIFTVLGVALVLVFRTTESLLVASLIATLLVCTFFSVLLKRYLDRETGQQRLIVEPGFKKKIFAFSAAYFIAPMIFIMFSYMSQWIMVRLMDVEHVGIYSVAVKFSDILYAFGVIAGNVLSPNLSRMWEAGERHKVKSYLNLAVKINTLLLLSCAVLVHLLKDQLVPWLYGSNYLGCLPIVGMIMIFGIVQSINSTMSDCARLIEKTYIMPLSGTLGLLCNLALNFLLIPKYGIVGAAAATTLSTVLISVILFIWFYREGFKLTPGTLLVCALPFMLLFNKVLVFGLALLTLGIVLKTDWVLDDTERGMLRSKFRQVLAKYRSSSANKSGHRLK